MDLADFNPFAARYDKPCRFRVPFRRVWTDTVQDWVHATLWCHVVLRFFRNDIDQAICKCGSYGELQ